MRTSVPVGTVLLGYGLVTLLLWGGFALVFPYLILAGLVLCAAFFVIGLLQHGGVDRLGWLVLVNYAYWLLSGFVSGGLPVSSLTSMEFWSGEGRVFLYYLPLFPFLSLSFGREQAPFVMKTCKVLVCAGFLLVAGWVATRGRLFSIDSPEGPVFVGLITSHTGAGTFWGSIAVLFLIFGLYTGSQRDFIWGLLALALVLPTASRQGFISIFAALLWYGYKQRRMGPILGLGAVAGAAVLLMALFATQTRDRLTGLASTRLLDRLDESVRNIDGASEFTLKASETENFNAETRMFLWSYSLDLFAKSPLVGVGFGRFNDPHRDFSGIEHVFYLATTGDVTLSEQNDIQKNVLLTPGNAHNSYLHLLAETGLLGLGLLLYLWRAMYRALDVDPVATEVLMLPEQAMLRACQGLLVFALVGALFGHGLGSPALGIVVTTCCGVALGTRRVAIQQAQAAAQVYGEAPWRERMSEHTPSHPLSAGDRGRLNGASA